MTPRLIDSHCHLNFPSYDVDRAEMLARMREGNVWGITVGTGMSTSKDGIAIADANDGVWATVGYHPEYLTSAFRDPAEGEIGELDISELRRLAQSSKKVVAIGETGLDFFRIDEGLDREEAKKKQEKGFLDQIHLAQELGLPVVIHCREALGRLAEIIQDEKTAGRDVRGVVHCYTGTWAEAVPLLDLGLFLSFTGIITFPVKKGQDPEIHMHRVIERMPLDRLMIETDAPFLTPAPHRGKRNEPAYVEHVAAEVARLRGMEVEDVARKTTENAIKFFCLASS